MCAYVLDKALTDFDIKFSRGEVPEFDFAPNLTTEEQLNDVIHHINFKVIKPLRLYEYFYIDTDEFDSPEDIQPIIEEIISEHHEEIVIHGDEDLDNFVNQNATGEGEKRYGVQLDYKKVIKLIMAMFPDENIRFYHTKFLGLCQAYNARANKMLAGFMDEAVNAVRGEIHYHKIVLKDTGLRRPDQRMLTSYFRQLDNEQRTK